MEFEVENLQSAKIEVYDYSKKGTCTFSKKGYGCEWTWETIQHYTWT